MATKLDKRTLKYAKKFLDYKKNPIKFIEEQIKIPTPGGDELMKLYRPQKKILESFFKDHHLILLKSRQVGFSTLSQAIVTFITVFYSNCVMGVLSRNGDEASDFCRKTEDMIDKLPKWLRPIYKTKNVQNYIMDNGCSLYAGAVSPANPGAVFRGKSITLLVMDELAHIPKIDQSWTGLAPALSKAQMEAKKKGIPYGTIFLSTPNKTEGIGKFFFDNWNAAINDNGIFKPHKIYWHEIPAYRDDPDWYKTQCSLLGNDKRKIAQELELKFIGAESCLFDEKVQEALQNIKREPLRKFRLKETGLDIWIFEEINKLRFHLIGVDTASKSGADYSTIQVVDYETMKQVMEFKGRCEVKKFSDIVKLVARMVPHNMIVVENNSYGNQVVEELVLDDDYNYNMFGETKGVGSNKKFTEGLNTNVKTRPLILDALFTYVNNDPESIGSERLALELLGLTSRRGRVEADTGFNDDLALSYAFICYVRHYCPQLLGNTEALEDDEAAGYTDDTINMLSGFNNDGAPLLGNYNNEKYSMFKKSLDRFIKQNVGVKLTGAIDVYSLFQDKK